MADLNDSASAESKQIKHDLTRTNWILIPPLILALLVVLTHLGSRDIVTAISTITTGLLWALACLVAGAAIGFLFGIPKVLQKDDTAPTKPADGSSITESGVDRQEKADAYRQRVNTNLTEISDWLTKIIVGLGLVNLHKMPPHLGRLADILAGGLNPEAASKEKGFAVALIVCFAILGFLFGYLYTRLFLAGAFARADQNLGDRIEDIMNRQGRAAAQQGASIEAREPTEMQLAAAAEVEKLVSPEDISIVKQKLISLAREYERIRATMLPGDERTHKMEIVVAQMRTLALAGYALLPNFINSDSPGERLIAVVMLQVKPNIDNVQWLAERFGKEKPFISYHAGVALLHAVRTFTVSELEPLESAVRRARQLLGEKATGTDRDAILARAEKELAEKT